MVLLIRNNKVRAEADISYKELLNYLIFRLYDCQTRGLLTVPEPPMELERWLANNTHVTFPVSNLHLTTSCYGIEVMVGGKDGGIVRGDEDVQG